MIRAILATAVVLSATWVTGAVVLARIDARHPHQPHTSLPEPRMPPLPLQDPTAHPATAPAAGGSTLTLESTYAPLPRPVEVQTLRPLPRPATARQVLQGAPIPLPPASLRNASDLSCIAVAIYHEARNQEDLGQRAVASVILQRAATPHRWGDTACDTMVPAHFSFLTSRYDYPPIDDMRAWGKAVRVAARALLEGPLPQLKGADHYHTTSVSPVWAPDMVRVQLIDDHVFYVDPRSASSL